MLYGEQAARVSHLTMEVRLDHIVLEKLLFQERRKSRRQLCTGAIDRQFCSKTVHFFPRDLIQTLGVDLRLGGVECAIILSPSQCVTRSL